MEMDIKTIKAYQEEIISILEQIGAKITYTKDLGFYAQFMTKISQREPIINIEAALMGEKFGIVIGYPIGYEKVVRTDKFKIFHVKDLDQFKAEWEAYIQQKLKS